jgi:alpha-tubulin suppressor-like RCC1 family protein
MENVAAISAGFRHALAVTAGGGLYAWGHNSYGQLGDGTTVDRNYPVRIMDDVIAVSAGRRHSLAVTSDGTLWAWGGKTGSQIPIIMKEE